jgi:hypothetical protein
VNEQELARKVAQALEAGLDDIPAPLRYRLGRARDAAMARAQDAAVPIGPARGGAFAAGAGRRMLAPVLALVLALAGMVYWQQAQRIPAGGDSAEFDSALLTDELPVTAYLDQGFEIWLYHETPASLPHE